MTVQKTFKELTRVSGKKQCSVVAPPNGRVKNPVFIGMDGGGTNTRAVAIDYDGNQLCEAVGGPANVALLGVDAAFGNIKQIFDDMACEVNRLEQSVAGIVLGLAGISKAESQLSGALLNKLNSLNITADIRLVNDAHIAWYGTAEGKPAIALISGTGSSSYGLDVDGNIIIKGGMGYLLSDEGSGYYIGLMGIRSAIRASLRIGMATALTPRLMQVFSLQSIEQAPYLIKDHAEIAAFARYVYEASLAGDEMSRSIIAQATDDLARLVEATWRDGNFGNREVKVGAFGSCLEKMTTLRSALSDRLQAVSRNLILSELIYPPVRAAAEWARKTYTQTGGAADASSA